MGAEQAVVLALLVLAFGAGWLARGASADGARARRGRGDGAPAGAAASAGAAAPADDAPDAADLALLGALDAALAAAGAGDRPALRARLAELDALDADAEGRLGGTPAYEALDEALTALVAADHREGAAAEAALARAHAARRRLADTLEAGAPPPTSPAPQRS